MSSQGTFDEEAATFEYEDFEYDEESQVSQVERQDSAQPMENFFSALTRGSNRPVFVDVNTAYLQMRKMGASLGTVLTFSESAAIQLLMQHRWNPQIAQEELFCGRQDYSSVLEKAMISDPSASDAIVRNGTSLNCGVCWESLEPGEAMGLSCGHYFCSECLIDFLAERATDAEESVVTKCPGRDPEKPQVRCCRVFSISSVEDLLRQHKGPELVNKRAGKAVQHLVTHSDNVCFCVNPSGCERVILWCPPVAPPQPGSESQFPCPRVTCDLCQYSFCFFCKEKPHTPATCKMLETWDSREECDGATAKWITAHGRPCPKCSCIIEKNQGCNHMTCAQCKYEFCWICNDVWSKHGQEWFKCRYEIAEDEKTKFAKSAAQNELSRYLHYHTKYSAHKASLVLDEKVWERAKKRVENSSEFESGIAASSVMDELNKTATTLLECRAVLMNSYIYAFYITDEKKKELFEFWQGSLELATEALDKIVETGSVNRQEAFDRTAAAEQMLKSLQKEHD